MSSPGEILEGLGWIWLNYRILAIFWHVVLAAVLVLLLTGFRPPRRLLALGLCVPMLSVSFLSLGAGDLLGGSVFLGLTLLLGFLTVFFCDERVSAGPWWASLSGVLLIAFGWVYPYIPGPAGAGIETALLSLYASPLGLLPGPTLSIIVGFSLLFDSYGSRVYGAVLGMSGLFYGLFGFLRLDLTVDAVLIAGSLILLIRVFIMENEPCPPRLRPS